jgi:hypothetical protein
VERARATRRCCRIESRASRALTEGCLGEIGPWRLDRRQVRLSVGVKPTWHGLFLLFRIACYMKFSQVDISTHYEVYGVEPSVLVSRGIGIASMPCTSRKELFIPMSSKKPMWLKQGVLFVARSDFPRNGTWSTESNNL